uniref:Uncharacterized protein n=1 Tax=Arundo donax TaxID=35708 RepID=A0A0A8ZDX9_ARUDO
MDKRAIQLAQKTSQHVFQRVNG